MDKTKLRMTQQQNRTGLIKKKLVRREPVKVIEEKNEFDNAPEIEVSEEKRNEEITVKKDELGQLATSVAEMISSINQVKNRAFDLSEKVTKLKKSTTILYVLFALFMVALIFMFITLSRLA